MVQQQGRYEGGKIINPTNHHLFVLYGVESRKASEEHDDFTDNRGLPHYVVIHAFRRALQLKSPKELSYHLGAGEVGPVLQSIVSYIKCQKSIIS